MGKPWHKPTGTGQFAFQNCAWVTGIWHKPGAIPNEPRAIFKIQFNVNMVVTILVRAPFLAEIAKKTVYPMKLKLEISALPVKITPYTNFKQICRGSGVTHWVNWERMTRYQNITKKDMTQRDRNLWLFIMKGGKITPEGKFTANIRM